MTSDVAQDLFNQFNKNGSYGPPGPEFASAISSVAKKSDEKLKDQINECANLKNNFVNLIYVTAKKNAAESQNEPKEERKENILIEKLSINKDAQQYQLLPPKVPIIPQVIPLYKYERPVSSSYGSELMKSINEQQMKHALSAKDHVNKKIESVKESYAFEKAEVKNKACDSMNHVIDSVSTKNDSHKNVKSTESIKTEVVEQRLESTKTIERLKYTPQELISIFDNHISRNLINSVKLSFTGFEPYLKKKIHKESKILYKKSDNAWVSATERLKKFSKDDLEYEKYKMAVQMCINKFNKNNKSVITTELESQNIMKSETHMEFLIDCIYRSITRYGNCVAEYAALCFDLAKNIKESKNKFTRAIINKFNAGTKVSEEWMESYNKVKNKKIVTVDDLDEMNEELQTIERFQSTICLGCSKMLACLSVCKFYNIEEALNFAKAFLNGTGIFDLEMLCTFLLIAGFELNIAKSDCLRDILKNLANKRKSLPLRQKFIVDEVLEKLDVIINPGNKLPKAKINITTITSNKFEPSSSKKGTVKLVPQRASASVKDRTDINTAVQTGIKPIKMLQTGKYPEPVVSGISKDISQSQQGGFKPSTGKGRPSFNLFGPSINVKSSAKAVELVKEDNDQVVFTYEMGRESLTPLLGIFMEQYDTHRLISELKELEIANNMDMFVKISYLYFAEQVSINCIYIGHMYNILFEGGRLVKYDFLKGFSQFLQHYNDLVLDVPALLSCISSTLIPLILSERITVDEYYEVAKNSAIQDLDNVISDLMKELSSYTTVATWINLWDSSKLCKNIEIEYKKPENDSAFIYADSLLFPQFSDSFLSYVSSERDEKIVCNLLMDYCKILHLCCSSGSPEMVDVYLDKIFSEQQVFYSMVSKSPAMLTNFFSRLSIVMQDRHNFPSCFIRCLASRFIRHKLVSKPEIEKVFNHMESDIFEFALRELKSVVVS